MKQRALGFIFLTLGYVFPIAFIPAYLTATVDWSLSRRPVYFRMAVTVIFATMLAEFIANRLLGVPIAMAVGLMGAMPAAMCSWLADKFMERT